MYKSIAAKSKYPPFIIEQTINLNYSKSIKISSEQSALLQVPPPVHLVEQTRNSRRRKRGRSDPNALGDVSVRSRFDLLKTRFCQTFCLRGWKLFLPHLITRQSDAVASFSKPSSRSTSQVAEYSPGPSLSIAEMCRVWRQSRWPRVLITSTPGKRRCLSTASNSTWNRIKRSFQVLEFLLKTTCLKSSPRYIPLISFS